MSWLPVFISVAMVTTLNMVHAIDDNVNDWDTDDTFECGPNQVLSRMASEFDDSKDDRAWTLECKRLNGNRAIGNCGWMTAWTPYANVWTMRCPTRGAIAGIRSHHSNHFGDREFNIRCCNFILPCSQESCYRTPLLNKYQHPIDYVVPSGYFIDTIISRYNTDFDDRKFWLEVCKA